MFLRAAAAASFCFRAKVFNQPHDGGTEQHRYEHRIDRGQCVCELMYSV